MLKFTKIVTLIAIIVSAFILTKSADASLPKRKYPKPRFVANNITGEARDVYIKVKNNLGYPIEITHKEISSGYTYGPFTVAHGESIEVFQGEIVGTGYTTPDVEISYTDQEGDRRSTRYNLPIQHTITLNAGYFPVES